jgi:hypothetical protein
MIRKLGKPGIIAVMIIFSFILSACDLSIEPDLSGFGDFEIFPSGMPSWDLPGGPSPEPYSPDFRLHDVTATEDGYLAVGSHVLYSTDGVNWEKVRENERPWTNVAYHNGQFVAIDGTSLFQSSDGVNWQTYHFSDGTYYFRDIVTSNEKLVVCASKDMEVAILTSEEDDSWSVKTFPELKHFVLERGASNGSQIVLIADKILYQAEYRLLIFDDGHTWNVADLKYRIENIIWDGQKYMAVSSNSIITSTDGYNWQHEYNLGSYASRIVFSGSYYVRWNTYSIYGSTDGVNWKWHYNRNVVKYRNWIRNIRWCGDRFIAVGDDIILTSVDGQNWEEAVLPDLEA